MWRSDEGVAPYKEGRRIFVLEILEATSANSPEIIDFSKEKWYNKG